MANERMLQEMSAWEAIDEFEDSIRRCEHAIFKSGPGEMEMNYQKANSELERARKNLLDLIHYIVAPDYVSPKLPD